MAIEIFEVQGMKKRKKIWFCIAVMLLLCLCGCEEEELPEEVPVNTTGQTDTITPIPVTPKPTRIPTQLPQTEYTEEQEALLAAEISLTEEQLAELREVLDQPVHFQYGEYFGLEDAFAAYETMQFPEALSGEIVKNRVVNQEALLIQVKKNNAEYLLNGTYAHTYSDYTEQELEYLCGLIAKTLTDMLKDPEIPGTYLEQTLSRLKIFGGSSGALTTYAGITEETVLLIYEGYIATLDAKNGREKILVHECMHLLQIGPDMNTTGINFKFAHLDLNPLYIKWFYESSAEFAATGINGEQMIYQNIMKSMDALMVATAFDEFYMEKLNFNHDLCGFYALFSCHDLISRQEIAGAMYAMDVAHYKADEFFKYYEDKTGITVNYKEQRAVKEKYMSDAHTVFAKKLLYDLSRQTLTLQEMFTMMSLFETVCNNNLFYTDLYRMRPSLDFISAYVMMQEKYFELLAESLGVTPEEIWDLYTFFHANEYIFLEALEKSTLLNSIYDKTGFNKGMTIWEAYERFLREGLPERV